jgi:hypothetical protein
MEKVSSMTLKVKDFGKILVTRQDAKVLLQSIGLPGDVPAFDFAGVKVVNHPFADELGKGLIAYFSLPDLSKVKLTGANEYVKNCLEAGFSTAVNS